MKKNKIRSAHYLTIKKINTFEFLNLLYLKHLSHLQANKDREKCKLSYHVQNHMI